MTGYSIESLGSLLSSKRKAAKKKSSEVLLESGINASLALYSQWEHDRKLPSPETLEKLCDFLLINKKVAFQLWAQNQMPTKALKKLFHVSDRHIKSIENLPQIGDVFSYPASMTKTIQERDAEFFIKNPAAGAILMRALAAGNSNKDGLSVDKLTVRLGLNAKQGLSLIKELLEMNYIVQTKKGYSTPPGIKYIFMPETETFERLRNERIKFNCARLLSNISLRDLKEKSAYRINLTNKLSSQQLHEVIDMIKETASTFMSGEETDDQKYVQLIALIGPEHEDK